MTDEIKQYVYDEQTGRPFEIKKEKIMAKIVATVSIYYLVIMLLFFLWQLFDIWVEKFTFAKIFGYLDSEQLTQSSTLICIYTFIGGALGGIVNEIRGYLFWHCDNEAYGRTYLPKAFVSPWLGGTLGIFVYFLMRSGIALFTGEFIPSEGSVQQAIPMFTIGLLAGYGSRKVFIWIDSHVDRIFKLKKKERISEDLKQVPKLIGMNKEEAEKKLKDSELKLGKVNTAPTGKKILIGKVISQEINPDKWVNAGSPINIIIGTEKE